MKLEDSFMSGNFENWEQVVFPAGILVLSVGLALIAHYVLFKVLGRVSRDVVTLPEGSFKRRFGGPARWLMVVITIRFVLPLLGLSAGAYETAAHIISLFLIGLVSWLLRF
ncbi:MAG: hypothetical protein ACYSYT_04660 [Planctomycetota bacterium]